MKGLRAALGVLVALGAVAVRTLAAPPLAHTITDAITEIV